MGIVVATSILIMGIPFVMYMNGVESGYGSIMIFYAVAIFAGFSRKKDEKIDGEEETIVDWLTISYLVTLIYTGFIWYSFL